MSKKICILGHGRHGKDTVAELISNNTGLTFKSSSKMAAMLFIYDILKDTEGYNSFEECYLDRHNHRALWHNMICEYNKEDKSRLAKDILQYNDIYVGMRSDVELRACKEANLFDYIIGVFDPNKQLESLDSFNIDIWEHCDFIIPTGDIEKVKVRVNKICKLLV
jgi:hypothetical protein